jgi:pimeloyl-ACP methyl ester carboxylesterase
MKNTLVFIHGLESTSQGTKAQYFRKLFPQMIIEDYTGDFETRMRKLKRILNGQDNLILVGSSFGGLMAARFALDNEPRVKKLILLAPALVLEGFEDAVLQKLQIPVIIYHGTQDNVVNPYAVKEIAEKTFSTLTHHLVDDDHPLNNVFPQMDWPKLLCSPKLIL